jgi:hypothetical protein
LLAGKTSPADVFAIMAKPQLGSLLRWALCEMTPDAFSSPQQGEFDADYADW